MLPEMTRSGVANYGSSESVEIITWRGVKASYTAGGRATMRDLRLKGASRDELWFLHMLHASFGARLVE